MAWSLSKIWFVSLFHRLICCCHHGALACILLSEKPSSTSRLVRQQIAKTVFKLFNFYSYIIFGVGGGVSKNYQEIKSGGGGWTNSAFANGGTRHMIISHLKPIWTPPFLIIIAQSFITIYKKSCLEVETGLRTLFFLTDICFSYENCTNVKC